MAYCCVCEKECSRDHEDFKALWISVHGKQIYAEIIETLDGSKIFRGPDPSSPPQYDWIKVEHKTEEGWKDSVGFESAYDAEEMWPQVEFRDKVPWKWIGKGQPDGQ